MSLLTAIAIGLGLALALLGWLVPRQAAGAKLRRPAALLLDAAIPVAGYAIFLAVTARPIFSGAAVFALCGGFAAADWCKRNALSEPIVFSDFPETLDILRHPRICLLFAHPERVAIGALAALGIFVALLLTGHPLWPWSPWPGMLALGAVALVSWFIIGPLCAQAAALLRKLNPSGDPFADAAALGPLAMQLAHFVIARAERASRQAAARQMESPVIVRCDDGATPLIVVQCESFFDPRRLHTAIAPHLLPAFDACCSNGVQWGRLRVPGWGANSVRSEFAALTGLPEQALGFDRFNPYQGFARAAVPSLAWRMRAAGYRTICIHPFDRRFYRRDHVMQNLGFDEFYGEEAFAGAARHGLYIADVEVARFAARLLREKWPAVFIFAITMENHGPWLNHCGSGMNDLAPGLPPVPREQALKCFLRGIAGADAMVRILREALAAQGEDGQLAFYGDHLPSLHQAFGKLGFRDRRSDYFIWRTDGGSGQRVDLAAHDLAAAIWVAHFPKKSFVQPGLPETALPRVASA